MNIIKDKNEWDSLLKEKFSEYYDTSSRYEYFDLYRKHFNTEAEGLFWENSVIKIFWPHLIRDLSEIEYFRNFNYYDLTAPYGHYGPLVIIKTEKGNVNKSLKEFFELYKNYAIKNNYICEFTRFHPIFENWKFFTSIFNVTHVNDMVIVDLKDPLDEIWKNMSKNVRRDIRKARIESGEVIVTDKPTNDELKTFFVLYNETMKRNNASQKYFFSHEFIKDHFSLTQSLLFYCKNKSNEIGSSSIFLRDVNLLHYHLSSTNYSFKYSPSGLILWEAMKWGKARGLDYLHLGGGKVKNDSLFSFKKSFSKGIRPLYIGKLIFDMETYNKLLSMNPKTNGENDYFPSYRYGLDETIV